MVRHRSYRATAQVWRRPLDEWLFDHLDSGFFGFGFPVFPLCGFLAAAPGNRAVGIWWRETRSYWIGCPPRLRESLRNRPPIGWLVERADTPARMVGDGVFTPHAIHWPPLVLGKWIRRHPGIYFSYLFRNVIKYAPYGWLFILFKHCCTEYPDVQRIWDATPKMRDETSRMRLLHNHGAPLSDGSRRAVDERLAPVYFLYWRMDLAKAGPGTFLDYLFSTVPNGDCSDAAEPVPRRRASLQPVPGFGSCPQGSGLE